jgi:hypothetical protein
MEVAVAEIDSLVEKILALSASLSPDELAKCKLLLGVAAGGLAPRGQAPIDAARAAALKTVIRSLAKMQPTGIAWRGKPEFLDEPTLTALRSEATSRRVHAEKVDRYLLAAGRSQTTQLIESSAFNEFIEWQFDDLRPSGLATYIYYEGLDSGLDAHLDSDSFSVNLILVLEHNYSADPSRLVIYNEDCQPERILIAPGEGVILYAGSTIHAREDLKQDENITLLTIGLTK